MHARTPQVSDTVYEAEQVVGRGTKGVLEGIKGAAGSVGRGLHVVADATESELALREDPRPLLAPLLAPGAPTMRLVVLSLRGLQGASSRRPTRSSRPSACAAPRASPAASASSELAHGRRGDLSTGEVSCVPARPSTRCSAARRIAYVAGGVALGTGVLAALYFYDKKGGDISGKVRALACACCACCVHAPLMK